MARTGMIARGLRGVRRMAHGQASTVYVLVKVTGTDALDMEATTEEARIVQDENETTIVIAESATVTRTLLTRAAAFAVATSTSGYRIWRKAGAATQAFGQNARAWSFPIAPTGITFTEPVYRILEDGVARILETGVARRLE